MWKYISSLLYLAETIRSRFRSYYLLPRFLQNTHIYLIYGFFPKSDIRRPNSCLWKDSKLAIFLGIGILKPTGFRIPKIWQILKYFTGSFFIKHELLFLKSSNVIKTHVIVISICRYLYFQYSFNLYILQRVTFKMGWLLKWKQKGSELDWNWIEEKKLPEQRAHSVLHW